VSPLWQHCWYNGHSLSSPATQLMMPHNATAHNCCQAHSYTMVLWYSTHACQHAMVQWYSMLAWALSDTRQHAMVQWYSICMLACYSTPPHLLAQKYTTQAEHKTPCSLAVKGNHHPHTHPITSANTHPWASTAPTYILQCSRTATRHPRCNIRRCPTRTSADTHPPVLTNLPVLLHIPVLLHTTEGSPDYDHVSLTWTAGESAQCTTMHHHRQQLGQPWPPQPWRARNPGPVTTNQPPHQFGHHSSPPHESSHHQPTTTSVQSPQFTTT
jgi:hypothetical protein